MFQEKLWHILHIFSKINRHLFNIQYPGHKNWDQDKNSQWYYFTRKLSKILLIVEAITLSHYANIFYRSSKKRNYLWRNHFYDHKHEALDSRYSRITNIIDFWNRICDSTHRKNQEDDVSNYTIHAFMYN